MVVYVNVCECSQVRGVGRVASFPGGFQGGKMAWEPLLTHTHPFPEKHGNLYVINRCATFSHYS